LADVRRSDFSGPSDLRDMQAMCSRLWSPAARFHPGQLAWNRYHAPVQPDLVGPDEAISIWRSEGNVVGFGWAEAQDWLELQVDPAYPEVADEVLEWFEDWSDAEQQSVMTMAGDVSEPALRAAGFEPDVDGWHFAHQVRELVDLPDVRVDGDYRLRHVEPDEADARAACHRAAWSDVGPSAVSGDAYSKLMDVWPYRHELDWVVVDGSGELVASALVWLDESTGAGLVEPVGCVPAHRGRGLAGAVTLAALHRLRDLGGRVAVVSPRGDADYPGPRRLYQSLGFRPTARTVTWKRSLD
jgi:predicted N-acetyltransferase YhbS